MPPVSQKQRGFMYAHAKDKGKLGAVAREYVSADAPGKLPERVKGGKPAPLKHERGVSRGFVNKRR